MCVALQGEGRSFLPIRVKGVVCRPSLCPARAKGDVCHPSCRQGDVCRPARAQGRAKGDMCHPLRKQRIALHLALVALHVAGRRVSSLYIALQGGGQRESPFMSTKGDVCRGVRRVGARCTGVRIVLGRTAVERIALHNALGVCRIGARRVAHRVGVRCTRIADLVWQGRATCRPAGHRASTAPARARWTLPDNCSQG